jgi:hypothetical protein
MRIETEFLTDSAMQTLVQSTSGPLLDAEREVAAFLTAVTELLGPDSAQLAAEYWIDQVEGAPEDCDANWRQLTITAAARVASDYLYQSRAAKGTIGDMRRRLAS